MKEPDVCERCGKQPEPPDFIFVGLCQACTSAIGRPAASALKEARREYHDDDEYPAGYRKPAPRTYEPDEGEWYRDRL